MKHIRTLGMTAGLLGSVALLGGCSDGERIATGAAIGALAGVALGSIDDGDVHVHSYARYDYGPRYGYYGPRYGRWYSGHDRWGHGGYGYESHRRTWYSPPRYGPGYRCDY